MDRSFLLPFRFLLFSSLPSSPQLSGLFAISVSLSRLPQRQLSRRRPRTEMAKLSRQIVRDYALSTLRLRHSLPCTPASIPAYGRRVSASSSSSSRSRERLSRSRISIPFSNSVSALSVSVSVPVWLGWPGRCSGVHRSFVRSVAR